MRLSCNYSAGALCALHESLIFKFQYLIAQYQELLYNTLMQANNTHNNSRNATHVARLVMCAASVTQAQAHYVHCTAALRAASRKHSAGALCALHGKLVCAY